MTTSACFGFCFSTIELWGMKIMYCTSNETFRWHSIENELQVIGTGDLSILLSSNGRQCQHHALKTSNPGTSYAFTTSHTLGKFDPIWLGREWWDFGKCELATFDIGIQLIQDGQVVFLIDLPRLPNGEKASDDQLTPFAQDLLHFLHAMTLTPRTIESLKRFDFSNTKHLAFVHSMFVLSTNPLQLIKFDPIQRRLTFWYEFTKNRLSRVR